VRQTIESCIAAEKWRAARKLIRAGLKKDPESHWLMTRLAGTYYQEQDYKKALHLSQKAVALAPNCPLVLWDYTGALEMLGRHGEALRIYRRLIRRGARAIAYGRCGEGLGWARGLIADCHCGVAKCYARLGQRKRAFAAFEKHLEMRGPGCRSIYPISTVRKESARLTPSGRAAR